MTKEALTLLVHEMEYVLSCINEDKIPFDGDDFHEALRLGKEALAQPEQEPVAMKFKIYKPTVPDPTRQGINNALLPWVYDQDRSSGFDATMWVTPVATLPPQRTWVGLTDEEIELIVENKRAAHWEFVRQVESILKEKNT